MSLGVGRAPVVSLILGAVVAAASAVPGAAEALQHDRELVRSGEIWLPLTGQLVHWTMRMAALDLSALLALGAWLEIRSGRRAFVVAVAAGALSTAAVLLACAEMAVYRGSSGMTSALFVRVALATAARHGGWRGFALRIAAVALPLKAAAEIVGGEPLFAGSLPPGVTVQPLVHLAGGLSGWWASARAGVRPPHPSAPSGPSPCATIARR
jgi:hypothetical protein